MIESNRKIVITTGRVSDIVTEDMVNAQLGLFNGADGAPISDFIGIAINFVESQVGYTLNPHTVDYFFPRGDKCLMLSNENITVISVSYYNEDNVLALMDASNYLIDHTGDTPIVKILEDVKTSSQLDNVYVVRVRVVLQPEAIASLRGAVILYVKGMYLDEMPKYKVAVQNILRPHRKIIVT